MQLEGGQQGSSLHLLNLCDCGAIITPLSFRWFEKPYFPRLRWFDASASSTGDHRPPSVSPSPLPSPHRNPQRDFQNSLRNCCWTTTTESFMLERKLRWSPPICPTFSSGYERQRSCQHFPVVMSDKEVVQAGVGSEDGDMERHAWGEARGRKMEMRVEGDAFFWWIESREMLA